MAGATTANDTRDRILQSAQELIHERGYEAVGVAEICARAKVNKGSFYHFFRTKENLGLAVIDTYWEQSRGGFDGLAAEGAPLVQLREFLGGMVAHVQQDKKAHGCVRGCLFGNMALELAPQAPAVQQRLNTIFGEQNRALAGLIRRGVDAGDLPEQDAAQSADDLIAFLEGAVLISKVRNDPSVFAAAEPAVFRLLGVVAEE
jgi:TetR/AcrR family transcriptional regulator, transcriptional repressor for nem operon